MKTAASAAFSQELRRKRSMKILWRESVNFLRLQGNGTSENNRRKTTENISVLVDKNTYYIVYYRLLRYQQAAVAQVVAHLIGSEEVTGPSPVSSSTKV